MMDIVVLIGEKFRELRESSGKSQAELARMAGVGRGTLRNLEVPGVKFTASLKTLSSVARALNISVYDVFKEPTEAQDDE